MPRDGAAVPRTLLIRCKFYLLLIFSSAYSPPLGDIKVLSLPFWLHLEPWDAFDTGAPTSHLSPLDEQLILEPEA